MKLKYKFAFSNLLTMNKHLTSLIKLTLLLLVVLIQVSCHKKSDKPTVAPPVRVTVMTVNPQNSNEGREYSATVSSSETTTVSFSVSGRIESLSVSEGQKVTKGQVLGRLGSGDYQNAKNIADATLAEAQDGYDRLKKLHDANALPEVKWVEMEQKLKQAKNAAEIAERTLNDIVLRSPVSGTVSRKFADVGQSVVPVQPIYEIISTTSLEVDVPVSENEVSSFSVGQPAIVSFENESVAPVEGKVKSKSVVADPLTRSFTIKIDIPSGKEKILPGMIANVRFSGTDTVSKGDRGIVLPSGTALLNHDNRWFVWVIKNNLAERRFVEVDELVAEGILVKSGLETGDSVIIQGMQKVGTGSKVLPIAK